MEYKAVYKQMDSIEEMLTNLEKAVGEFQSDYKNNLSADCEAAREDVATVSQLQLTLSEAKDEFCQRLDLLRKRVAAYVPDTAEGLLAGKKKRTIALQDLYSSLSAMGLSMSPDDVGESN